MSTHKRWGISSTEYRESLLCHLKTYIPNLSSFGYSLWICKEFLDNFIIFFNYGCLRLVYFFIQSLRLFTKNIRNKSCLPKSLSMKSIFNVLEDEEKTFCKTPFTERILGVVVSISTSHPQNNNVIQQNLALF